MTREQILKTEWNPEVDELCKNRMVQGFFSYGPIAENYGSGLISAKEKIRQYLDEYDKTGNIEKLLDIRNFAAIEYRYPSHPNAHFEQSNERGIKEMTYRDIERL